MHRPSAGRCVFVGKSPRWQMRQGEGKHSGKRGQPVRLHAPACKECRGGVVPREQSQTEQALPGTLGRRHSDC